MYPLPREFTSAAEIRSNRKAVRTYFKTIPEWVKPSPPPPPPPPPLIVAPIAGACCDRHAPERIPVNPAVYRMMRHVQGEKIKRMIALHYHLTRAEIEGDRRTISLTHPRQIAFYLCARYSGLSMPQIGRLFGNRDHSTVMHGAAKITRNMTTDPQLAADVAEFVRQIEGWSAPATETGGT